MSYYTLRQVRRKAFWYPTFGAFCATICFTMIVVGAAKGLYEYLMSPAASRLDHIFLEPFARVIAYAYESAAEHAPWLTKQLWLLAPTWTFGSFYPDDGFLAAYLPLLAAVLMRARGLEYKRRVQDFDRHMQLVRWEESERGIRRTSRRPEPAGADVSPKLPWHQGLFGTIILGIAIPLLGKILELLLGISKLP